MSASRKEYCKRRHILAVLRDLGFQEVESSGDHDHYALRGHKVTVVARDWVTHNEAMSTVRTLERMGFDRREIRARIKGCSPARSGPPSSAASARVASERSGLGRWS